MKFTVLIAIAFLFFTTHTFAYTRNENSMADVNNIHGVNIELNTGAWQYQGHLATLQPFAQPAIGFLLGGRSNKLTYDFSCNLHWATTPTSFTMRVNDSMCHARYSGAGYLGLDLGYQLFRQNAMEVDALCGLGLSVFDAAYDSAGTKSFHSPDVNLGLGYRYYFRHHQFDDRESFCYLALQAKYHLLFYSNPAATPIDGNAFSLTLAIGSYNTSRFSPGGASAGFGKALMNAWRRHY